MGGFGITSLGGRLVSSPLCAPLSSQTCRLCQSRAAAERSGEEKESLSPCRTRWERAEEERGRGGERRKGGGGGELRNEACRHPSGSPASALHITGFTVWFSVAFKSQHERFAFVCARLLTLHSSALSVFPRSKRIFSDRVTKTAELKHTNQRSVH